MVGYSPSLRRITSQDITWTTPSRLYADIPIDQPPLIDRGQRAWTSFATVARRSPLTHLYSAITSCARLRGTMLFRHSTQQYQSTSRFLVKAELRFHIPMIQTAAPPFHEPQHQMFKLQIPPLSSYWRKR